MVQFLERAEATHHSDNMKRDLAARRLHRFPIPEDAGARVALVADLMRRLEGGRILVVFDQWGVWPSGERMHLFARLRASYGDMRHISKSPGQLFSADEFDDAVSFVTLGVLFLWDVDVTGKQALHFSHDEVGHASFDVGHWRINA